MVIEVVCCLRMSVKSASLKSRATVWSEMTMPLTLTPTYHEIMSPTSIMAVACGYLNEGPQLQRSRNGI